VYDQMIVIAHDGVSVNATRKNLAQLQNALLNPEFSVLKGFFQIFIKPAELRTPHAAGNALN